VPPTFDETGPIMTTERDDMPVRAVLDSIRDAREALSVRRVFGDPYEIDGTTIVPVARIGGGGGGGAGEGRNEQEAGGGFGSGFGLHAQPLGIYEIRDGEVAWRPTVDVTRLVRGAQALAAVVTVCTTLVAIRRPRPSAAGRRAKRHRSERYRGVAHQKRSRRRAARSGRGGGERRRG
jgi:uncharacterized spore protein YtfJ